MSSNKIGFSILVCKNCFESNKEADSLRKLSNGKIKCNGCKIEGIEVLSVVFYKNQWIKSDEVWGRKKRKRSDGE